MQSVWIHIQGTFFGESSLTRLHEIIIIKLHRQLRFHWLSLSLTIRIHHPYFSSSFPHVLFVLVFVIGGKWPYSCCVVGCCFHNVFKLACSILVLFPFSLFSLRFVKVHVVHPYSSIDSTSTWKKSCFILLSRSDFYMINNMSIAVHILDRCT